MFNLCPCLNIFLLVKWICQERCFKFLSVIGLTNKNSYQSAVLVLLPLSPVQKGCGGGKKKVLGGSV